MKNTLKFALTALLLAVAPLASANAADGVKIGNAVKAAVAANSSQVLDIVAANVAANESCACEIVKAAIVASDADSKQVAKIVNTAILQAPSQIRVIAQCAIATAPDAVSSIQKVVEKYDAAGGDGYSVKGGMGGKEVLPPAPTGDGPNPLDYPYDDINDPIVEINGWLPPFFFPPVEDDTVITGSQDTAGAVLESLAE